MATLFPKLEDIQKHPRKLDICVCTGGPGYDLICRACSEVFGVVFHATDINEVGRKGCAYCGDTSEWRMDSVQNPTREKGGCIVYFKEA